MSLGQKLKQKRAQQGVTLIELLIAASLSSFVMLIVLQMMSIQGRSARLQSELGYLHENSQFGLSFIRAEFQRSGYNGTLSHTTVAPIVAHLSKEDVTFDEITLQRRLSGLDDRLCTGASPQLSFFDHDDHPVIWSQYRVQEDANRPGHFQLVCRYFLPGRLAVSGDQWVPKARGRGIVMDGLEAFQVQYGVRPLLSDNSGALHQTVIYVPYDQWQPDTQEVVAVKLGVWLANEAAREGGRLGLHYETLVVLPNVPRRWFLSG